MHIIAVVSQKGGTGKSTVCASLAVAASRHGLATLVADTDPQGSLADWSKLRASKEPMVLAAKARAIHPMRFAAEKAGVQLMVIDTQAASLACAVEAAKIADLTLIVTRPSPVDLRAVAATVGALKPLRRPCALVLNQAPSKRSGREPVLVDAAVQLLLDHGLPIVPSALRGRAVYQQAYARGLSAAELVPEGEAANEICRLWSYVLGRLFEPARKIAPTVQPPPLSAAFLARSAPRLHQTPAT
ncbi:MAG TPA: AAA family ATPase [Caulobacteraceae bacterium]|jgi:chromosome partitioning protein|nr:AAA family ATPase [Caulobacteraceae bacterium]